MAAAAGVIGLIIWPRIDDQRRRSLLTRRLGAAFTASQLVTERDWLGWPGRRRSHACRIGAARDVRACGPRRTQISQFGASLLGIDCSARPQGNAPGCVNWMSGCPPSRRFRRRCSCSSTLRTPWFSAGRRSRSSPARRAVDVVADAIVAFVAAMESPVILAKARTLTVGERRPREGKPSFSPIREPLAGHCAVGGWRELGKRLSPLSLPGGAT
jgi:hypothetical protein